MAQADGKLGTIDGSHLGNHLEVHLHNVDELDEKKVDGGIINDDLVAEFITEKGMFGMEGKRDYLHLHQVHP
jgi:hypothetical protein